MAYNILAWLELLRDSERVDAIRGREQVGCRPESCRVLARLSDFEPHCSGEYSVGEIGGSGNDARLSGLPASDVGGREGHICDHWTLPQSRQ